MQLPAGGATGPRATRYPVRFRYLRKIRSAATRYLSTCQKRKRIESWTMRGSPALVILPNVELFATLAPGALKCGLFSRSKKSPRNCAETRSVTLNVLAIDQSKLNVPGARNRLRGLFPNVPGAASVNAAVL